MEIFCSRAGKNTHSQKLNRTNCAVVQTHGLCTCGTQVMWYEMCRGDILLGNIVHAWLDSHYVCRILQMTNRMMQDVGIYMIMDTPSKGHNKSPFSTILVHFNLQREDNLSIKDKMAGAQHVC